VVSQPKKLRRLETGKRRVASYRTNPLFAYRLVYLFTLFRRSLVVPKDRRPDYFVAFIKKHCAMHLPGDADAVDTWFLDLGKASLDSSPPILRILLRPKWAGNA